MDKLIVIGGVVAGTSAAARARRCCKDARITVYEQGEFVSYAG
jgi:NADPH-dependent 2,4-dienoyl-CoA reductase/sulfur reductase-like enzyme